MAKRQRTRWKKYFRLTKYHIRPNNCRLKKDWFDLNLTYNFRVYCNRFNRVVDNLLQLAYTRGRERNEEMNYVTYSLERCTHNKNSHMHTYQRIEVFGVECPYSW
jgi:hypothetical protein